MSDNVIVRVPEQQFIRGEDGYSPEVTIENIEHGHSVTITDREHQEEGQTFNVLDGASAYEQAVAGGYTGTEAQFNAELSSFKTLHDETEDAAPFYAVYGLTTISEISSALNRKGQVFLRTLDERSIAPFVSEFRWSRPGAAGRGFRFAKIEGTVQYVYELADAWTSYTNDLNAPADRAEEAAAAALNRMNSADQSAQSAALSASDASRDAGTASTAATTATEKAGEASDSATAADGSAKDAEAYAVGKHGGTDVGSSDPAYHNNSKYYAEQAASSAADAVTAKGAAETAQGAAEDAQAAAEAVLASIPEDYTELTEDVDNLKSAVIKTTTFNLPISNNTATYRSIKHDFVAGKKYTITAKCANYQPPSTSGYAIIVRTTNNYVDALSKWDSQVVDTFIIVPINEAAQGFDVSYDYTPELDAKYLSYYTKAGTNITLSISIAESTDDSISQDELTANVVIPRFLIKAKTNFNTSGKYVSNDRFATSELLSFSSAVHISTEDPDIIFIAYYDPFSTEGASGYVQDLIIPPGMPFRLVILDVYASAITSDAIESVKFYLAPDAANDFTDKYYYKITDTMRARDFDCTQYGHLFAVTPSLIGYSTAEASANGVKSTKVLSSDYNVTVMVTRLYDSTCYVIIDNAVAATVVQGNSYTVPAGTEFVLSSSNGGTDSSGYNIVLCVSKPETHKQFCLPYTPQYNDVGHAGCAFIDDTGALYIIGDQDNKYHCFVDGTKVVDGVLLDGPVGHANTCNYIDGKVYISGWLSAVNGDVYVYSVNSETHTLTYDKTITVPTEDTEAIQHFVMDGERTILSFGMCDNYSAMRFAMLVLANGSYVKAREFKVALRDGQAGWIQGMTVKENKLYYIMGYPDTVQHLGIGILDLGNALIEVIPAVSAVSRVEIEAIIPIADKLFMLVDSRCGTYLQYIE